MLHTTDEAIAAFSEGRLGRSERARLIEHVDRCPTCREILAETVRARQETRGAEVAAPRRLPVITPGWSIAAAVAVLLVAAIWVIRGTGGAPEPPTPAASLGYVAMLSATEPVAGPDGAEYAFGSATHPDRAAFRLGRQLVLMEHALVREDGPRTANAGRAAGAALAFLGGPPAVVEELRTLVAAAESGRSVSRWRDLPIRAAETFRGDGPHALLALGAWVEAARLAASTGDLDFFDAAEIRSLREAIHSSSVATPGVAVLESLEVESDLRRIRRLLTDLTDVIG